MRKFDYTGTENIARSKIRTSKYVKKLSPLLFEHFPIVNEEPSELVFKEILFVLN